MERILNDVPGVPRLLQLLANNRTRGKRGHPSPGSCAAPPVPVSGWVDPVTSAAASEQGSATASAPVPEWVDAVTSATAPVRVDASTSAFVPLRVDAASGPKGFPKVDTATLIQFPEWVDTFCGPVGPVQADAAYGDPAQASPFHPVCPVPRGAEVGCRLSTSNYC
ncbi:hypothetical protein EXN66_Car004968 [Channa argus]|uniref:Uncharacterized protein n=1 Tax=Channa argus TaxID=215402 RepID=A0A6G1PGZ8_CHAAH|nr:hypothetical protein EXN66_Car004968 [Channa argus]